MILAETPPVAGSGRSFPEVLASAQSATERAITVALKDASGPVADAMRYATEGGKGLRAFLALESARLHGIEADAALPAAAAVECLHAYSLVHDDLPCMDDDDLRRGRPTIHKCWDEATAVLAGDALQSLAFEFLTRCDCPAAARIDLVASFAVASGVRGMVGGQALDIAAETAPNPLTLDEITRLQDGKTGALIRWSATVGPRMAGADHSALDTYAAALGLAFQIADDILDIEGSVEAVGKATGKDVAAGKATFVSLLGLGQAKCRAEALVEQACDAVAQYGAEAECLRDAARFVIARDR